MAFYLSKEDTIKGQIVFGCVVLALIMQRVDNESGIIKKNPEYRNLAVEQLTALIDEILVAIPEPRRSNIVQRVDHFRAILTKRTRKLHIYNSFLGALDVMCTNYKTRPGTRFDFIVQALRQNYPSIRNIDVIGQRPDDEAEFKKHFKDCIKRF